MEHLPSSTTDLHAASAHPDEDSAHVVSFRILLTVFVGLLVLTYITVAARYVNLGGLNIWIALGIATLKGALVVLYFMHLRYDSPFYSIVFVAALVCMFLFMGIAILDTIQYQPAIDEMTLMQGP
ncbi:MAG: cytochrome C oxidase subunit IV family protein [Pirellulaceae bacterium]